MVRLGIALCVGVLLLSGCGGTKKQAGASAPATTTTSSVTGKKVVDHYHGPTLREILARTHRSDSAVTAIQSALLQKDPRSLSPPERVVLVVEALENEVNNGGYDQFFLNDPSYAHEIVVALKQINCPDTARITEDAEALLGVRPSWTDDQISSAAADLPDAGLTKLNRIDDRFYAYPDPIADRLLSFIRAHASEIGL